MYNVEMSILKQGTEQALAFVSIDFTDDGEYIDVVNVKNLQPELPLTSEVAEWIDGTKEVDWIEDQVFRVLMRARR